MLGGMDARPSPTAAMHGAPALSAVTRDVSCDGLQRQGEAVLVALGERRLAREFCRRARTATDRETLVAALLDCLDRRRPR